MKQFILAASMLLLLVLCACSTPWVTDTPRSAVEQYLISTTVDRCVGFANFMEFMGKKAFMDYEYFAPQVDKPYAQGVLETRLSSFGIVITKKLEEADIIVQPLCGVLGTDHNKFFIGTPALPIPVMDTSISVVIPEIPIFMKFTRKAYGKFSFNIFTAKGRKPIKSVFGVKSSAVYVNWIVFLVPFRTNDMNMQNTVEGETYFEYMP